MENPWGEFDVRSGVTKKKGKELFHVQWWNIKWECPVQRQYILYAAVETPVHARHDWIVRARAYAPRSITR